MFCINGLGFYCTLSLPALSKNTMKSSRILPSVSGKSKQKIPSFLSINYDWVVETSNTYADAIPDQDYVSHQIQNLHTN